MKKRSFLLPVALAVSALLGTAAGGNVLANSLFPSQKSVASSPGASAANLDDLVITPASSGVSPVQQHSSHGSHNSHNSHGSHNSHNSHASGG